MSLSAEVWVSQGLWALAATWLWQSSALLCPLVLRAGSPRTAQCLGALRGLLDRGEPWVIWCHQPQGTGLRVGTVPQLHRSLCSGVASTFQPVLHRARPCGQSAQRR